MIGEPDDDYSDYCCTGPGCPHNTWKGAEERALGREADRIEMVRDDYGWYRDAAKSRVTPRNTPEAMAGFRISGTNRARSKQSDVSSAPKGVTSPSAWFKPLDNLPRPTLQPQRFRKRPVEIEAVQLSTETLDTILRWVTPNVVRVSVDRQILVGVAIRTLEGEMVARPTDWIIRGVAGEFYPCRDDIFRKTYEGVVP